MFAYVERFLPVNGRSCSVAVLCLHLWGGFRRKVRGMQAPRVLFISIHAKTVRLLNRYRVVKPYRGFESLRLRQYP